MPKPNTPNVHEIFLVEVMRTSEILQFRVNALLKEYALTNPQYNILGILRGAKEALSIAQLRERMLYQTSDVSRLLDRLVKKGLVSREVCPDHRRRMDVVVTKIGLQVLDKLDVDLKNHMEDFYNERLSAEEAIAITATLREISK